MAALSSLTKRKREIMSPSSSPMAFDSLSKKNLKTTPPSLPDPSLAGYDVFINYHGPGLEAVATVLQQTLLYLGLKVYLDPRVIRLECSVPANIQQAIDSSSVHVPIFWKGYANSPSCLAELLLILKSGAKIIPLFYDVAPFDLRSIEKGIYATAFAAYAEDSRYTSRLDQWKSALHNASLIPGIEFDSRNGNLGTLCTSTVDIVIKEVIKARSTLELKIAEYPVGLDKVILELEATISSITDRKNRNSKIVGIVGEAGVGKPVLAKKFYNLKHSTFWKSSFLSDVGQAHRNEKMREMREKLMHDIIMPLPLSSISFQPSGPREGFGVEALTSQIECLHSKPLIIVDGVDNAYQLEALAVNEFLNHGALIIVTCRDANILKSLKGAIIYEMRVLDASYARELFCWHAFHQPHPPQGQEELVEQSYPWVAVRHQMFGAEHLLSAKLRGDQSPAIWAPVISNSWRTTGDIEDKCDS